MSVFLLLIWYKVLTIAYIDIEQSILLGCDRVYYYCTYNLAHIHNTTLSAPIVMYVYDCRTYATLSLEVISRYTVVDVWSYKVIYVVVHIQYTVLYNITFHWDNII